MPEIVITQYDAEWPGCFSAERSRLVGALAGLPVQVEHVGSTSVPGLGAKPMIDIMVGLAADQDLNAVVAPLEALGYSYVPRYEAGEQGMPFRRYFRNRPPDDPTESVHVHCVHMGSNFWTRQLAFRNHLRMSPGVAADYERLKRKLAPQFTDGNAYAEAKTDFVEGVLNVLGVRPVVRRVQAGDAATWRRIRLAALADAPDAFGSTYAGESTRTLADWEQSVARSAQGFTETRLFAEDNARACGIAAAFRPGGSARPDTVMIVSVWVAPAHRRHGVGGRLVDGAVQWARAGGHREVVLWATQNNEPAKSLYLNSRFRFTGRREPLRSNTSLQLEELQLPLN